MNGIGDNSVPSPQTTTPNMTSRPEIPLSRASFQTDSRFSSSVPAVVASATRPLAPSMVVRASGFSIVNTVIKRVRELPSRVSAGTAIPRPDLGTPSLGK